MMTQNADKNRSQVHFFCMDDIVPKDHLLRLIDRAIVLSQNICHKLELK